MIIETDINNPDLVGYLLTPATVAPATRGRPRQIPIPEPGFQFDDWTVVGRVPNRRRATVLCRCKCGTEHEYPVYTIHVGSTAKSCANCRKKATGVHKDQQFGSWTVVRPEAVGKWRTVLCRCSCGEMKEVPLSRLLNEDSTQCIKCRNRRMSVDIREGQKYGCWTVKETPVTTQSLVFCRCNCGREAHITRGTLLRRSKYCSDCKPTAWIIPTIGVKYGQWEVIRDLPDTMPHMVLCKCSCGNIQKVQLYSLRTGKSKRCFDCSIQGRRITPATKKGEGV